MQMTGWLWRLLIIIPMLSLGGLLLAQLPLVTSQADDARQAQAEALRTAETVLRREADHAHRYLVGEQQAVVTSLKQRLAEQVDGAHAVLQAIYTHAKDSLPPADLQNLVRNALRDIRFFDGRGYYFIDGMDGRVILMPLHPQNEGTMLLNNRDDQGTFIMQGLIKAAQQPGGAGFFSYRWYGPESKDAMEEKVAYVRHFVPYDWLIGAGDYVPAMEHSIITEAVSRLSAVHFGETGAIGLANPAGTMVLFPEAQDTASPSNSNNGKQIEKNDNHLADLQEKLLAKARAGGGLLLFDWPHPQFGRTGTRVAWVEEVNDGSTEWVIYASAHLSDFLPQTITAGGDKTTEHIRIIAATFLLILASFLVAWLIPVRRHGS